MLRHSAIALNNGLWFDGFHEGFMINTDDGMALIAPQTCGETKKPAQDYAGLHQLSKSKNHKSFPFYWYNSTGISRFSFSLSGVIMVSGRATSGLGADSVAAATFFSSFSFLSFGSPDTVIS